ncbi:hypothetical protein, partial [Bacteroides uniformis]|uniref:hypothetical protein n=1 Tax=Bacteroides uniformis TaxID=820 RepID=UPI001AA16D63
CPLKKDSPDDDDNNNNRRDGNQRNKKFQGKRKAPSGGNDQPFKRSRNSRYEESNVADDKKNEFILVSALSAASPL